jgi:hypothetical protein
VFQKELYNGIPNVSVWRVVIIVLSGHGQDSSAGIATNYTAQVQFSVFTDFSLVLFSYVLLILMY